MRKIICEATNTYTNISLFMNDYISLFNDKLIDKETYGSMDGGTVIKEALIAQRKQELKSSEGGSN